MENNEENIPQEFICPITLQMMKDPVIMPDGQTYEREAIENYLRTNPISPLTREPMTIDQARPNYSLKSLIENFKKTGQIKNPENQENNPKPKEEDPNKIDSKKQVKIKTFKAEAYESEKDKDQVFMNITVEPEKETTRKPILLIAMIDVSGSMQLEASNDVKGGESLSFTRMALVKHSLKTIVSTLGPNDQIELIKFSGRASIELYPTFVNDTNKDKIFDAIKKLKPNGCTNIWDALRIAINEAQKFDKNFNTYLMLFTDGEPNENPPMGIVPSLKETISDIKVNFTISTFAFGYSVDSKLMNDIAVIGNGAYGYCPDCTMMGTIFTNYLANVLSTVTPAVFIKVENKYFENKLELGPLYSDMPRHASFYMSKKDYENTKITLSFGDEEIQSINTITLLSELNEEMMNSLYRFKLIELIRNNMSKPDFEKINTEIKQLFSEIDNYANKTEYMKNLLIDLINEDDNHGQIEKAFDDKYFKKWGQNYLYSFLRFHVLEQCGNFKDQSLQLYGGEDFEKYRKQGNKIFINLPPPEDESQVDDYDYDNYNNNNNHKKDKKGKKKVFNINNSRRAADFINLCYNSRGGCFSDTTVQLKDGNTKKISQLLKGDILKNGAIIECLVINEVNCEEDVVDINGISFSPYHPIYINGKWEFPCNVGKVCKKNIDKWYNLVLNNVHEVEFGDFKAITLGHNRTDNNVVKHPYFGTDKVVNALKKYDSYKDGIVITKNIKLHRGSDNLVDEYY